ncbi:MAG: hypothetical protein EBR94_05790 [Bacteroidetes bacterium]|nr:hypothetical protein [Bacteroidota bacterium]
MITASGDANTSSVTSISFATSANGNSIFVFSASGTNKSITTSETESNSASNDSSSFNPATGS